MRRIDTLIVNGAKVSKSDVSTPEDNTPDVSPISSSAPIVPVPKIKKQAKTECNISREFFRTNAQLIEVQVGGTTVVAAPREFSTGSLGWNVNQKVTVKIAGVSVVAQIGLNLTLVGSKTLPLEDDYSDI